MQDKRKFIRLGVSLKGKLEIDEGWKKTDSAVQIVDCSREGIRIRVPQKVLLKASTFKLEFYLSAERQPIVVQGIVRWIKNVGQDYEIGMKFDKIAPEKKSELLEYAYQVWRKNIKR